MRDIKKLESISSRSDAFLALTMRNFEVSQAVVAVIYVWKRTARFRLNGLVTTDYPSGKKKEEGRYERGKKVGEWLYFHENGNRFSQKFYVNGKLHGKSTRWFDEGELSNETEYVNGKAHGRYVGYFPQGPISDDGEYFEGKKHGTWRNHHINSAGQTRVESVERYDKGKRISAQYFD